MQKRRLGRTELIVSCIGLGAGSRMFMGRYHQGSDTPHAVINRALDEGINFIDTARSYYKSEKIVGEVIKGRRDECFLASKTYLRKGSQVMKDIDISLKNLQTDRIDLYQIHNVVYKNELNTVLKSKGALGTLKKAKGEGKLNYIGITAFHPEIIKECIQTDEFDTIQIPFNFSEITQIGEIFDLAKKFDVGIIIMRPLSGGEVNSAEGALKFILGYDVSIVIPGCSTVEHVQINARVGKNLVELPVEKREKLFLDIIEGTFCRGCKLCEPVCPVGISVSEIFHYETYLYFNATYARSEYRRFSRRISTCIDCGECEKLCPYNLPIRVMLKRADRRLKRGIIEDIIVNLLRRLQLYSRARELYFDLGLPLPKR
ncbi:aldo/keto reductase [Candidatus Omnitrophota bacterium]